MTSEFVPNEVRLLVVGMAMLFSWRSIGEESGTWNPTLAELKAKNGPHESWEGPAVTELLTMADLDKIWDQSQDEAVIVFKHSTTCGVSARAAHEVNGWLKTAGEDRPPVVFLKVRERRPLSNAVAERTGVKHESPQILVIEDGKCVWNASHGSITVSSIQAAVAKPATPKD